MCVMQGVCPHWYKQPLLCGAVTHLALFPDTPHDRCLAPGGTLIIEPQPWKSYHKLRAYPRMIPPHIHTRCLAPGGTLIIEPQPWKSYHAAVHKRETCTVPFRRYNEMLKLRPEGFADYLTSQVGSSIFALYSLP